MSKAIKLTFGALIAIFLFILGQFFIPVIREFFRGSEIFLIPIIIFFLLGVLLIFLTLKEKTKSVLGKFLLLTGFSAAGFFLFIFLHNIFYGLEIMVADIFILNNLVNILGIIFFITAIFLCPLGFIVGLSGSLILFKKKV